MLAGVFLADVNLSIDCESFVHRAALDSNKRFYCSRREHSTNDGRPLFKIVYTIA